MARQLVVPYSLQAEPSKQAFITYEVKYSPPERDDEMFFTIKSNLPNFSPGNLCCLFTQYLERDKKETGG
jgi:hypothetical protein